MAADDEGKPRIVAGAAMMTSQGAVGEGRDPGELSRRMAAAYEKALADGVSAEERSKRIDEAIMKFQHGDDEG